MVCASFGASSQWCLMSSTWSRTALTTFLSRNSLVSAATELWPDVRSAGMRSGYWRSRSLISRLVEPFGSRPSRSRLRDSSTIEDEPASRPLLERPANAMLISRKMPFSD
jgi:hypothetical protein